MDGDNMSSDQAEEVRVTDRLLMEIKVTDKEQVIVVHCLLAGTSIVNLTSHQGLKTERNCGFRSF